MENILASAKGLLRNKNLVTIVGVIIVLALLYWGYSSQINSAVQPVSIPVATTTIQPRTEITDDMVTTINVPSISVSENVMKSKTAIVGKYSNVNTVIPNGSMFYTDTVIDKDQLPDSAFIKVKKGEVVYSFNVNMESTYGNSIMPGNMIDLYMKIGDGSSEKVMLGRLIENLEVLAVKDSSGRDVFENTDQARTPSMFIFGVPEDIYLLLMKASYMRSLGVELFPVIHGGQVSTDGTTEVSTQQLADYIEAHSVNIPITQKTETDKLLPTFKAGTVAGTVTVKFPKGCGFDYTCTYTDATGRTLTAKAAKKSKTVSKTVTFAQSGTITAILTEEDGTAHTATYDVVIDNTATNSANTNQVTG